MKYYKNDVQVAEINCNIEFQIGRREKIRVKVVTNHYEFNKKAS